MSLSENTRLLSAAQNGKISNKRPPLLSIPSSLSMRSSSSFADYHELDSLDISSTGNKEDFNRWAYVAYYLPILKWLPEYDTRYLLGDFLAGVSLASFQIPLVMSLATSLAKLPPLVGLYSVVAAAIVYPIFGGVPVLVVGPSPSTAVLYGQVVESMEHDSSGKFAGLSPLEISAALSLGMSAILLASGLLRYGFLDNVLSRALLKGFIGAMGVIMITNQLDVQLGLQEESKKYPHASMTDKWWFAIRHCREAHVKTVVLTCVTLFLVLYVRRQKAVMVNQLKKKWAVYIPELLGMVVFATLLSYKFNWEGDGIAIVGNLVNPPRDSESSIIINPFEKKKLRFMKSAFSTSFICSILGFIDSTTATKALGAKYNYNVSSNREFIALGACNLAVSFFGGLPSFGALGRSKVNILAGAVTPLASIIMSITVLLAVLYFLPLLYYLPQCVLSLSTTIIGITVIEEVPHDISFFWRIGGYNEIAILLAVFCTTIFWNVEAGVILGIILSVIKIINNSSRSQIHILGRISNTSAFRNADELIEESFASQPADDSHETATDIYQNYVAETKQIAGVLIIRIPEPLNFANFADLRSKLNRYEKFGTLSIHPSQPSSRMADANSTKLIIFDCKGMSSIDASATQGLFEAISRYNDVNQINVAFSRVSTSKQVRDKLILSGIQDIVNENTKRFKRDNDLERLPRKPSSSRLFSVSAKLGDGFYLSIEEAVRAFGLQDD